MQSFSDTEGRSWQLSLNGYTLEQVKDGAGVLLTKVADDEYKLLIALQTDFILLVKVLWCMCEDQAEERSVTPKQFAKSLQGDALGSAGEALVRAIIDFFTNPEVRRALQLFVEKARTLQGKVQKAGVEQLTEKLAAMDDDQLVKSYMDSFTNSQASLTPIPDLEHLGS